MTFSKVYIYYSEVHHEVFTVVSLSKDDADEKAYIKYGKEPYNFVGLVGVEVLDCESFKIPIS